MIEEARLEKSEHGVVPTTDGWFVVNAREAPWWHSETFGSSVVFESREARFPDVGVNIQVLPRVSPTACTTGRTRRRTSSCCPASAFC